MNSSGKFPVVGIGASAGGIEALEGFFRGLPSAPGMAFVIVTHLSPDRESLLPEIVARLTTLTVLTAQDGVLIEPDHVYVMPQRSTLGVRGDRLAVYDTGSRQERKPVDVFFSELAGAFCERSAGVVLSGGDADGTLGLKAIKAAGGVTLAQTADGFGPRHPDMPNAAISAGFVDFAVPVDEMGSKLLELMNGDLLLHDILDTTDAAGHEADAVARALPDIYVLLNSQVGHDFSGYKKRTFVRRVQRRMQITQMGDIVAYVDLLRKEPQEVGMLFRDLLINVTSFFRDEDAFESLVSFVIPNLLDGRGATDVVRIWVPGCATGEEVYSIAMLMREHMDHMGATPKVQIFATDIDERALSVARMARYPAAMLQSVSPERRMRFFVEDGASYVVGKEVRDLCIFSPHSVIRDPPFSRIDLVSCRNLLIYFGPEVQARVIPTFHYALKPDGYLFLGSAENVTQFDELFSPVEKHHRIFRRRSVATPTIHLPTMMSTARGFHPVEAGARRPVMNGTLLRQAVDSQMLERFAPAHVLVNQDGDVVYFSNRTSKYLEVPAGTPTRHLLTLARRDMRLDLRTLLRETLESGMPAQRESIAVEMEDGRVQMVCLMAQPFRERPESEQLCLVVFVDQGPLLTREEAMERLQASQNGASLQTERELRETRERLQSLIEEYETALEELKSSNEELVSVNEEMQSTNEELEASKEELQSVNEELHTVNHELNGKVEALDRANSDLVNLFDSTDVATIFLDTKLVIRSFTPAVSKVFSIRPTDVGRPLSDLSSKIDVAELANDIHSVFTTGTPVERRSQGGQPASHYLVRIAPYIASGQRAEGVVVAFLDVTTLVLAEDRQHMLIAELQHRTRNLLGMVQAVAKRTLPDGDALDGFHARLAALGRAQSILSSGSAQEINMADMMRLELDAMVLPPGKVALDGPNVALSFDVAQTLSLALHELTTNAVKHGALGRETGHLDVSWTVTEEDDRCVLTLVWHETGVHIAEQPTRKGFGRELIERALGHTLKATTHMDFRPEGLVCTVIVPYAKRRSRASAPAEMA